MNNQRLRIMFGGAIALISLVSVVVLSVTGHAVPETLSGASVAAMAYVFGVTTNGSGLGGTPKQ